MAGEQTSGDPLFGVTTNQAWCASTGCEGDYTPFVFSKAFGDGGTIYTLGSDLLQADINLSALGYGYLFVPQGVLNLFDPDQYSAAVMLAVQGGPSVSLNLSSLTGADLPVNITDTLTGGVQYTDSQETEAGSFGETVGVTGSLTSGFVVNTLPGGPITLAQAYYTPGLMITWNTEGNPGSLGMSYSAYSSTTYATEQDLASIFDTQIGGNASLTATVTPSTSVSWGLFYKDLSVFQLSVGYQNPISAGLTIPLNDFSQTSLSLTSQGTLTASAALIPGITSHLSWSGSYPVYSVTDQIQPASSL